MPREDIALFIDLETTGSDKRYDDVIEIGISAIDLQAEGFPEIAGYSHVRLPSAEAFIRMMGRKVVVDMHTKNGLLDEIEVARQLPDAWRWNSDMSAGLREWLDRTLGTDPEHVHYGGSGVMHFDRPFIDKTYPFLSSRLAYYAAFDIGPTRRQFAKAGVVWMPYANTEVDDPKTHRALDDARFHADEFRWSQRFIRGEA